MSKSLPAFSVALLVVLFPVHILAGFLQGKPAPEMESFWLYEAGYKHRIAGADPYWKYPYQKSSRLLLTSELGYMKNMNPKSSFGGTAYLGLRDNGSNFGVRARYRRWLSTKPYTSLDFSLGISLAGSDDIVQLEFPGIIASVAYNIQDLISFSVQQEFSKYTTRQQFLWQESIEDSGIWSSTYLGVQGGSYLGVAATAVIVSIVIIAIATMDFDFSIL